LAPAILFLLAAVAAFGASQVPSLGANAILHPARRPVATAPPSSCKNALFDGAGVTLRGWRCRASGARRGTVVSLHGVADNRTSATGIIDRFVTRGLDVVAYDSRAHGESGGEACTYGFFEKEDLRRVIDQLEPGPIVLIGTSLGGAVALQEAATDRRITAIVAAETFSDLRTVVADRAPSFLPDAAIDRALTVAAERGHFDTTRVSPVMAARTITAPVLLIHGAVDVDTPPEHSRRVFAALGGRKQFILVPDAAHNQSLAGDVWRDIDEWIDRALPPRPSGASIESW
jgi:pimeloyl-ACP methyl ester carboxylesterase